MWWWRCWWYYGISRGNYHRWFRRTNLRVFSLNSCGGACLSFTWVSYQCSWSEDQEDECRNQKPLGAMLVAWSLLRKHGNCKLFWWLWELEIYVMMGAGLQIQRDFLCWWKGKRLWALLFFLFWCGLVIVLALLAVSFSQKALYFWKIFDFRTFN